MFDCKSWEEFVQANKQSQSAIVLLRQSYFDVLVLRQILNDPSPNWRIYTTMDPSSAPLADYFWIAGIDSISYNDSVLATRPHSSHNIQSAPVETTIEEGSENGSPPGTSHSKSSTANARHSRSNSWNRLSKWSNAERDTLDEDGTQSNRSSMTIKASATNGSTNGITNGLSNGSNGDLLGDFDFDKALLKFANEREHFLDDLSYSAGATVQKPPPMTSARPNPRTGRLKVEESENGMGMNGRKSPLRSVGGSIRRKISFRDMSSVRRQTSTVQRSCK